MTGLKWTGIIVLYLCIGAVVAGWKDDADCILVWPLAIIGGVFRLTVRPVMLHLMAFGVWLHQRFAP